MVIVFDLLIPAAIIGLLLITGIHSAVIRFFVLFLFYTTSNYVFVYGPDLTVVKAMRYDNIPRCLG